MEAPGICATLLEKLSNELREVDVGTHVSRVDFHDITPLQFATEYVAKNKPCIITGAISDWPALQKWNEHYLCSKAGDQDVTVDVTPNGQGDAVTYLAGTNERGSTSNSHCAGGMAPPAQWFVTPDERHMSLQQFFQLLRSSRTLHGPHREVPYVQHQNNSLAEEFPFLLEDMQPPLAWADEVFGSAPEAVNLWIGDNRSVTSFHKDHYENLYAVITGTKIFTLLPPSDIYRMYLHLYPTARYCQVNAHLENASQHTSNQQPRDRAAAAASISSSSPAPAAAAAAAAATAAASMSAAAGGHPCPASYFPVPIVVASLSDDSAAIQMPAQHASCTTSAATAGAGNAEPANAEAMDKDVVKRVSSEQQQQQQQQQKQQQATPSFSNSQVECSANDEAASKLSLQQLHDDQNAKYQGTHSSTNCRQPPTSAHCASVLQPVLNEPPQLTSWSAVDPYPADFLKAVQKFPKFFDPRLPKPLVAKVGPGELLYLPSMWYHHVQQRTSKEHDYVTAVNFWYDMKFDIKYAYFKLVEALAAQAGLAPTAKD